MPPVIETYRSHILRLLAFSYIPEDDLQAVEAVKAFLDEHRRTMNGELWWPLRDVWTASVQLVENQATEHRVICGDTLRSSLARCVWTLRQLGFG